MSAENIRVFVRIKPGSRDDDAASESSRRSSVVSDHSDLSAGGSDTSSVCSSTASIAVLPESPNTIAVNGGSKPEHFTFDCVAGDGATQEDVFKSVGKVISENVIQGYNGTIFAYGQTGSGKTYTMQGPVDDRNQIVNETRGLIPRILEYIFGSFHREQQKQGNSIQFLCKCSYLEIYNESVYDLLDPTGNICSVREDLKTGVYVEGITEEIAASPEDALRVLERGAANRHVAATAMNRGSSRSHSVFTLTVQSRTISADNITNVKESKFNLIDLAGSERQKTSQTAGSRLKEASAINKSLSVLGNVINALVDIANGRQRHVSYRDSKLTFLLRDSLGGNAKTFLIANVNPAVSCYAETLSTLRFAQRAKMIKNKAVINENTQANISQLQEEIRRLKDELKLAQGGSAPNLVMGSFGSLASIGNLAGDGTDATIPLRRMLTAAIERKRATEDALEKSEKKVAELEEYARRKDNQLRNEKMVTKFRDNSIRLMREKDPQLSSKEMAAMQEEIQILRHTIEFHPELVKVATENLDLKEKLAKLQELVSQQDCMESREAQRYKYERDLERQIVSLEEKCASLGMQLKSLEDSTLRSSSFLASGPGLRNVEDAFLRADLQIANEGVRKLEADLAALREKSEAEQASIRNLEQQKEGLANQLEEFKLKKLDQDMHLESAKNKLKEQEIAFNQLKEMKDLEIQRLREAQMSIQAEYENTISALKNEANESIRQTTSNVSNTQELLDRTQQEAGSLREALQGMERKYRAEFEQREDLEKKVARMAATATESRNAHNTQIKSMSERLSMACEEKDKTDAVNAELMRQVENSRIVCEELKYACESQTKILEEMSIQLEKEKSNFESEFIRYESEKTRHIEELEQWIQKCQDLQVEQENTLSELDYQKRQADKSEALVASLNEMVISLEKKLKASMDMQDTLQTDLEKLAARNDKEEYMGTISQLRDEIGHLHADQDVLKTHLKVSDDEKRMLMATISDLRTSLSSAETSREDLLKKVSDVRGELQEAKKLFDEASQEINFLSEELIQKEAKFAEEERKSNDTIERLTKCLKEYMKESEEGEAVRIRKLDEAIHQQTHLKSQLDSLKKKLISEEKEKAALESKLQSAMAELSSVKKQKGGSMEGHGSPEKSTRENSKSPMNSEDRLSNSFNQMLDAGSSNESITIETAIAQARRERKALFEATRVWEKEKSELLDAVEEGKQRARKLEDKIFKTSEQLRKSKMAEESAAFEAEELRVKLQKAKEEILLIREENARLQEGIDIATATSDRRGKKEADKLQPSTRIYHENDRLRNDLSILKEENQWLQERITQMSLERHGGRQSMKDRKP